MAESWGAIDELPATYGSLAADVAEANRNLARRGVSRMRRSGQSGGFWYLRAVTANTLVYLATENQKVVFWFPVGRPAKDVILRLEVAFTIAPVWENRPEDARPWEHLQAQALIPSFLGLGISFDQKQKLAQELGEGDWSRILFLGVGLFRMAAVRAGDWTTAQVSWMWHGADQARTIYRRVASPGPQVAVSFEPEPFLMLLSEVEAWVRSEFRQGVWIETPLPAAEDPKAVRRIVAAIVQGWRAAAMETAGAGQNRRQLLEVLLPESTVRQYRADVSLRLKTDGTLAEKKRDDNFRLRLSVEVSEEGETARAAVRVGPADFLVSGDLHAKLLELIRLDLPVTRLFRQTGLPGFALGPFQQLLDETATAAAVFRVDKDDNVDTELFVFRGDWNGETRTLVVSAKFKVTIDGDQIDALLLDDFDSMVVIYSNLPSPHPPKPHVLFPRYLLSLVDQLGHWQRSLT